MSDLPFDLPQLNDPIPSPGISESSVKTFLATRRSTPIKTFDTDAAGPSERELQNMMDAAMRVPDHRRLGPWRMIVISGAARARLGDVLATRFVEDNPDCSDADTEAARNALLRAPVCVVVVSSPVDDGKTPVWEQELSAGALCMNLLYMAHASGYAASWLSEWWAFDKGVADAFGLKDGERIAGNIFIGKSKVDLFERPRADMAGRVTTLTT